jgi:Domain of unknown function (DUF6950)
MVIKRRHDWVGRMRDAIIERQAAPFEWGAHDCCRAPCAVVEAMTGVDVYASLHGYKTARGAAAKMRRKAGKDIPTLNRLEAVAAAILAEHGCVDVPVLKAHRGDLVMVNAEVIDGGLETALSIVDLTGSTLITAAATGGWLQMAVANGVRAWRVSF